MTTYATKIVEIIA